MNLKTELIAASDRQISCAQVTNQRKRISYFLPFRTINNFPLRFMSFSRFVSRKSNVENRDGYNGNSVDRISRYVQILLSAANQPRLCPGKSELHKNFSNSVENETRKKLGTGHSFGRRGRGSSAKGFFLRNSLGERF